MLLSFLINLFCENFKDSTVLTGFGHAAVLSHADTIVSAVKSGAIKRFFVVGGCDGAEAERSYFKDVATGVPKVRERSLYSGLGF